MAWVNGECVAQGSPFEGVQYPTDPVQTQLNNKVGSQFEGLDEVQRGCRDSDSVNERLSTRHRSVQVEVVVATVSLSDVRAFRASFIARSSQAELGGIDGVVSSAPIPPQFSPGGLRRLDPSRRGRLCAHASVRGPAVPGPANQTADHGGADPEQVRGPALQCAVAPLAAAAAQRHGGERSHSVCRAVPRGARTASQPLLEKSLGDRPWAVGVAVGLLAPLGAARLLPPPLGRR